MHDDKLNIRTSNDTSVQLDPNISDGLGKPYISCGPSSATVIVDRGLTLKSACSVEAATGDAQLHLITTLSDTHVAVIKMTAPNNGGPWRDSVWTRPRSYASSCKQRSHHSASCYE